MLSCSVRFRLSNGPCRLSKGPAFCSFDAADRIAPVDELARSDIVCNLLSFNKGILTQRRSRLERSDVTHRGCTKMFNMSDKKEGRYEILMMTLKLASLCFISQVATPLKAGDL